MKAAPSPRERSVTVIAQDPTITMDGDVLLAKIVIPNEQLEAGPAGYRVQVVDYDATTDTLYLPDSPVDLDQWSRLRKKGKRLVGDILVANPEFHRSNVYSLVMKTLARFEFALGRRVGWGFGGHQLKVAPHAFSDANAFYSEPENALLFGYFMGKNGKPVFTCLSHDVVVHETTHALVDGLRERYREPSSPDQAAFHEGFADVIAILSVFSLPSVIESTIDKSRGHGPLQTKWLEKDALRESMIFGLAEQVGQEIDAARGGALRRSLDLPIKKDWYTKDEEFKEPHRRGEILVAAMLTAFVDMWSERLKALIKARQRVDRSRAIEEGADIADCLLTSAIRALDYAPPVDLLFSDYLSALLTADREIRPSDTRYNLRARVTSAFAGYGITPASGEPGGFWKQPDPDDLTYEKTHFEAMQRDDDEVFHFLWENREAFELYPEAFTRVTSVRPCTRVGPDGFVLHETVCEYVQTLQLLASELSVLKLRKPTDMPPDKQLKVYGGGALIFDEYGRLKYHVYNPMISSTRQQDRLDYLWATGALRGDTPAKLAFWQMHLRRGADSILRAREEW